MPSDSLAGARLPTYIVDAFSARPFGGNQAAVCLVGPAVSSLLSDADRQKIASEMNLSETAFLEPVRRLASGGGWTPHCCLELGAWRCRGKRPVRQLVRFLPLPTINRRAPCAPSCAELRLASVRRRVCRGLDFWAALVHSYVRGAIVRPCNPCCRSGAHARQVLLWSGQQHTCCR